ncbi:MAG: hypothetical protein ACREBW_05685, partial [Candidatus Micrarchaeaceae archaeon]
SMAREDQELIVNAASDLDTVCAGELAVEAMIRMGITDQSSAELFTDVEQACYERLLIMFLGEISASMVDI